MTKKPNATSAGAIVIAEIKNKIMIALAREPEHGDNAWVIPKGHVKDGESFEQTALREVAEEVGLTMVQLIKYLGTVTRQSKEDSGEIVQKTIHLFLAYSFETVPRTIADKSSIDMQWFELKDAIKVIPFKEDSAFVADQLRPLLT